MTHFEYLIVAFSILVAMGLARLLEGLIHVLRTPNGYWIHTAWLVYVLLGALILWWELWELNEFTWTMYSFLTLLAGPMLVFAQAAVLVPQDPDTVDNWKEYFYANAKMFFLVRAVAGVQALVAGQLLTDVLPTRALVIGPVMFVLFIVAAYTRNERFHAALAIISLVLFTGVLVFNYQ